MTAPTRTVAASTLLLAIALGTTSCTTTHGPDASSSAAASSAAPAPATSAPADPGTADLAWYSQGAETDAAGLQADFSQLGTDIGAANYTAITKDCGQLSSDLATVHQYQTAPDAQTQKAWTAALAEFDKGAAACKSGAAAHDTGQLLTATTDITIGTTDLTTMSSRITSLSSTQQ